MKRSWKTPCHYHADKIEDIIFFYDDLPRYTAIDEDEAPYRLLCHEYKRYL